jgi:hypothetical protein
MGKLIKLSAIHVFRTGSVLMFRLQIDCWFVCVTEVVTDIKQIYELNERPLPEFELPSLID